MEGHRTRHNVVAVAGTSIFEAARGRCWQSETDPNHYQLLAVVVTVIGMKRSLSCALGVTAKEHAMRYLLAASI